MSDKITNNEVNNYLQNLQIIGKFGVYENRPCTGYAIRVSEKEADEFVPRNGMFISESEFGNFSIMLMKAPDDENTIGIDDTEKLKFAFKVSGLTLEEAEAEARTIKTENDSFCAMMKGKGGGVTTKPPVAVEFNIEE